MVIISDFLCVITASIHVVHVSGGVDSISSFRGGSDAGLANNSISVNRISFVTVIN